MFLTYQGLIPIAVPGVCHDSPRRGRDDEALVFLDKRLFLGARPVLRDLVVDPDEIKMPHLLVLASTRERCDLPYQNTLELGTRQYQLVSVAYKSRAHYISVCRRDLTSSVWCVFDDLTEELGPEKQSPQECTDDFGYSNRYFPRIWYYVMTSNSGDDSSGLPSSSTMGKPTTDGLF